MPLRGTGPRRSRSLDSYLWQTRALAGLGVLALAGGIASDALEQSFWGRHALLAGVASSVIVVVLTVALVNEVIERRQRRRWSVLAQYVMLQLVRDARVIWTGVAERAGVMPTAGARAAALEAGSEAVQDTARLTGAVRVLVADAGRRRQLHDEIARFVVHDDEVLGRWAGVMLNADIYAEIIDRHVELASNLAWLASLLDASLPPEDEMRRRKAGSHPAVQIEGGIDDEQLANRLVAITQLAERLDRATLEFALRIVPIEWWAARLGSEAIGAGTRGQDGGGLAGASQVESAAAGNGAAAGRRGRLRLRR